MLNIQFLSIDRLQHLTTKALRLIPHIETFTDIDGRVVASYEDFKDHGLMTPRLLPEAFLEMEHFDFLGKDADGNYYNKFHYLSSKNEKNYNYVNLYEFFGHKNFKGLYKRDLMFFYYILTSKLPGHFHTIAAELLYMNEINKDNVKFTSFQDFKDMATHLAYIVSLGFLELQLGKSLFSNPAGTDCAAYANKVKDALYTYCSKDSNKKSRIRNKRDRHLLKIRVTESLVSAGKKSTYETRSTLKDLHEMAAEYGHDLDDFHIDYLKPVHMLKEKLHREFGKVGITMYRDALKEYFQGQSHKFANHIIDRQFADIIKKIYVMPKITFQLHSYLSEVGLGNWSVSKEMLTKTENYIEYLTTEAYYDDMILFNVLANEKNEDLLDELINESRHWEKFHLKVKEIYDMERKLGNGRNDVYQLALEGKLTNIERQKEDYKRFTILQEQAKQAAVKKVPFYNWLDK
ncbi:hypothetical protein [Niallia sp. 03190]|uniref:hypothetical protein n=1 Tax=Niallia sp. 03190 TaxID=3458061 RepID=UPI004044910B